MWNTSLLASTAHLSAQQHTSEYNAMPLQVRMAEVVPQDLTTHHCLGHDIHLDCVEQASKVALRANPFTPNHTTL